eukprot:6487169-Amphidinium_carterae.3
MEDDKNSIDDAGHYRQEEETMQNGEEHFIHHYHDGIPEATQEDNRVREADERRERRAQRPDR